MNNYHLRFYLLVVSFSIGAFPNRSLAVVDNYARNDPEGMGGSASLFEIIFGLLVIVSLLFIYAFFIKALHFFEEKHNSRRRKKEIQLFQRNLGSIITPENLREQSRLAIQRANPQKALSIAAYFGDLQSRREFVSSKYVPRSTQDRKEWSTSDLDFVRENRGAKERFEYWLMIAKLMSNKENNCLNYFVSH